MVARYSNDEAIEFAQHGAAIGVNETKIHLSHGTERLCVLKLLEAKEVVSRAKRRDYFGGADADERFVLWVRPRYRFPRISPDSIR